MVRMRTSAWVKSAKRHPLPSYFEKYQEPIDPDPPRTQWYTVNLCGLGLLNEKISETARRGECIYDFRAY